MIYKKIYSFTLAITGVLVFFVLPWMNELISPFIPSLAISFIEFFSAYGFFRLFTNFMLKTIDRSSVLKRMFFSSSYFEGMWVGYYVVPVDKKHVIFFKKIEQSVEKINLVVHAYHVNDGSFRGKWKNNGGIFIDHEEMELSYLYDFSAVNSFDTGKSNPNSSGTFVANYFRQGLFKSPHRLVGIASNFVTQDKFQVEMKKVYNVKEDDIEQLKKAAREFYISQVGANENGGVLD